MGAVMGVSAGMLVVRAVAMSASLARIKGLAPAMAVVARAGEGVMGMAVAAMVAAVMAAEAIEERMHGLDISF